MAAPVRSGSDDAAGANGFESAIRRLGATLTIAVTLASGSAIAAPLGSVASAMVPSAPFATLSAMVFQGAPGGSGAFWAHDGAVPKSLPPWERAAARIDGSATQVASLGMPAALRTSLTPVSPLQPGAAGTFERLPAGWQPRAQRDRAVARAGGVLAVLATASNRASNPVAALMDPRTVVPPSDVATLVPPVHRDSTLQEAVERLRRLPSSGDQYSPESAYGALRDAIMAEEGDKQWRLSDYIARTWRVAPDAALSYVREAWVTGERYDMDPVLLLAVMAVESSFNPKARSHVGAQGLMQVHVPVHGDKFRAFGGVQAATDPKASIDVGARILLSYLKRYGSERGALKAYVGAARMKSDGGYGKKVLGMRDRFAAYLDTQPAENIATR